MKLSELLIGQKLLIQLLWGEQKIEFFTDVVETDAKGAYVAAYVHQGNPLELKVDRDSKVQCNIFTNATGSSSQRIEWKSVEISTIIKSDKSLYYISTSGFNNIAKQSDRRQHDRMIINKKGKLLCKPAEEYIDIIVHDISDIGISFYIAPNVQLTSHELVISWDDSINEKPFSITVECSPVRQHVNNGLVLYGCKTVGDSRDFLVYGLKLRLTGKNKNKPVTSEIVEDVQD